jgi:hypothetical protein
MASSVVNALATTFQIKERTGDKRTLALRGRALPYRPFELSGTQRHSVEWYPGSPIGTLQVYGAKEEPTTISGAWKDVFLGAPADFDSAAATISSAPSVSDTELDILVTARELVNLVDDMRRKGQELEVTWLDQIRRGILERFTVRWLTGHDCEWEIAFVWISQGESLSDIRMESDVSDLGDLPNRSQNHVDALSGDSAELVPQSGIRFSDIATDLSESANKLQEMTDELTDAVAQASGAVTEPGESLRRMAGILGGLKLQAEAFVGTVENTADGILLDLGELTSFGHVLAQRGEIRERSRASMDLRNLAAREEQRLLDTIRSEIVRIFQAREDQDLRDVSLSFYDTPEEWRSLMVYNRLSSSQLAAGQVVFVPARPAGTEC